MDRAFIENVLRVMLFMRDAQWPADEAVWYWADQIEAAQPLQE